MPHEMFSFQHHITTVGGRTASLSAYNCYQVIVFQAMFFYYFKNTNQQVLFCIYIEFALTLLGMSLIFDDDGLLGIQQFFYCPSLTMTCLFQILMMSLRNYVTDISMKLVFHRYSDLLMWYTEIEETLAYEEFENIN